MLNKALQHKLFIATGVIGIGAIGLAASNDCLITYIYEAISPIFPYIKNYGIPILAALSIIRFAYNTKLLCDEGMAIAEAISQSFINTSINVIQDLTILGVALTVGTALSTVATLISPDISPIVGIASGLCVGYFTHKLLTHTTVNNSLGVI
jgi:hypothetical protein